MQVGFQTLDVLLRHRAGQDCLLPEGFVWWYRGHQFRHRPGGHTDGMSSPQFTHCLTLVDPYGWALPAAVAHDGGYHDDIEQLVKDIEPVTGAEILVWKPFPMSRDECDVMFKELLDVLADGDERKQRLALVFYEAVHLGGLSAYDAGHRTV